MNPAHVHLLVNHLPIFGALLALPLLGLALWRRGEPAAVQAAALVVILASAGGVAAEMTGEEAEHLVEETPGASEEWIEEHEARAEIAEPLGLVNGLAAIVVVYLAHRRGRAPMPALVALGVLTVATAGAMAWTGQAGGFVMHAEIREP